MQSYEMAPGKQANLSTLMARKAANKLGGHINVCPFGCEDEELDDSDYCRHLVGFSNDKKTYEPMVEDDRGRRIVQVPFVDGKQICPPCLKGDQFVQITTSYRVYRDVDKQK